MTPRERAELSRILDDVRAASRAACDAATVAALIGIATDVRRLRGDSTDECLSEARLHHVPPTRALRCPRCRAHAGALLPHRDGMGACCALCLDESTPRSAAGGVS